MQSLDPDFSGTARGKTEASQSPVLFITPLPMSALHLLNYSIKVIYPNRVSEWVPLTLAVSSLIRKFLTVIRLLESKF